VAYVALKLVQQATLVRLTRPFLRCDRKRVADVALASGEIQKNPYSHYNDLKDADQCLDQTFSAFIDSYKKLQLPLCRFAIYNQG